MLLLFCCFMSTENSWGCVGVVSQPNHIIPGQLRTFNHLTSTKCTYFHQYMTSALLESAEKDISGYRTQDLWLLSQMGYQLGYVAGHCSESCIGTPLCFSTIFMRRNKLCDFLFLLLEQVLPKWSLLLKERIFFRGSKLFL